MKLKPVIFLLLFVVPLTIFANAHIAQTSVAQTFISYLEGGNFVSADLMFSPSVSSKLSALKLKEIWQSLIKQFGVYESITGLQSSVSGGYVVVITTLEFEKAHIDIKFVFDDKVKIVGFWISKTNSTSYLLPSHVDTSKFIVKRIEIGNKWKIPAEITIPKGKGPFIGIVLVPGSGPDNMNETIGPNEPFKDIAYALSSKGMVVLRYDKRTFVYRDKVKLINLDNVYFKDVNYAINYLNNQQYVKKSLSWDTAWEPICFRT